MYRLLWLIPVAVIIAGIWGATLIPQPVLAVIGFVAILAGIVALVVFCVMWMFAEAMRP